jgi:TPR repeat protein
MWEGSAASGVPYSIFMLHWVVKKSITREEADKAFQKLLLLGETGNYRDKWRLGRIYQAGFGVPIDSEKCIYWHSKAAENGWAGIKKR